MTVCVCIDDGMGISFNSRRQSKDMALISKLCSRAQGKRILIKEYSAKLFSESDATIQVTNSFSEASADDFFFVECEDAAKYIKDAECVIIYRWNRRYPSDVKLSAHPDSLGFKISEQCEFKGNSHEKITEEIWIK